MCDEGKYFFENKKRAKEVLRAVFINTNLQLSL
jgi:hypothetical protein